MIILTSSIEINIRQRDSKSANIRSINNSLYIGVSRLSFKQLEKDLWESADDLRANSKLTATEYAQPVLGLIFLSHATSRFYKMVEQIELTDDAAKQMGEMVRTIPDFPPKAYDDYIKGKFDSAKALYLPSELRFDYLTNLAGDQPLGSTLDGIMRSIESLYPILTDVLPKTYSRFEIELLQRLVRIFSRPALKNATGDVFGRIYEYFLNKFAQSGAQEGGEFFTPPSLVKTMVNFIEPDHGVVFDPAVGSAGMFIQTTHFLEDHHITNAKLRFAGQEKSENNQRLAIMNMVVHGLDATNIRQGNTFYDRQETLIGGCDFVMANPPFNVDAVDASKCQIDVLPDISKLDPETGEMIEASALEKSNAAMVAKKRLPFGLSGVTKRKSTNNERADGGADKNDVVSNANSLWIQYFYSYLNATGRAGFVMASSASDSGGKDKDIRQQLVETGHVDVMVSIGNKFFYTRSLPCTLWFFDKGKKEHLVDHVLMLDARSVYTVVSPRSHVFSDAQLAAMTAIVHLNRGELDKYNHLLAGYLRDIQCQLNGLPSLVASSSQASRELAALLSHFADLVTLTELNNVKAKKDKDGQLLAPPALITEKQLSDYQDKVRNAYQVIGQLSSSSSEVLTESLAGQYAPLMTLAQSLETRLKADVVVHVDVVSSFDAVLAKRDVLVSLRDTIVARHQDWLALVEEGAVLRAGQSKAWMRADIKVKRLALLPSAPEANNEEQTIHDEVLACLDAVLERISDIEWLHARFPDGVYADVLGLCKRVSRAEIAANDYSLTAGRYVGVVDKADDLGDFSIRMNEIHLELSALDKKAAALGLAIEESFRELLG